MRLTRRSFVGVVALCVSTSAPSGCPRRPARRPASAASPSASSAAQVEREREMKAAPSAKLAEADFDVMTAEPHHTGSPYEIKLADYVSDQFKQFGIEPTKYEYSVLLPWPGRRRIDIVAPDHGQAARSRKRRSAATSGPTSRASCRRTTPTRRPATSPARSST